MKGLYLLFVTEMAERFSYYGMRAIFVLYLVAAFFDGQMAAQVYGSYTGLVYLAPLIGGYIADRYWGNRRSIIVGGILMAVGQFLMFGSALVVRQAIFAEGAPIDTTVDNSLAQTLLFAGLAFLILGNGFFKPNISTMVGDLYDEGDRRRDSAFTIFYMGINVGAFIAPFVCGTLGEGSWNDLSPFRWGFFSAGVAMVLSVVVFVLFKDRYLLTPAGAPIGMAPKAQKADTKAHKAQVASQERDTEGRSVGARVRVGLFLVCLASLFLFFAHPFEDVIGVISAGIYSVSIALPVFIITDGSLTAVERRRIGVIYIVALFVIFFWSAFEQAGSSLTIFADRQVDRWIGDWEFKTSWFQSINPIVVVVFAPVVASVWSWLGRRGCEPDSPVKQAIGLLLLSVGYVVIGCATMGATSGERVSMMWLVALYFIHTIGELCLSPIGLSMVNRLSPARFSSLLMGVWFMSMAASNILAGNMAMLLPTGDSAREARYFLGYEIATLSDFFMLFALMAGSAAVVLFALCPMLRRMMR